MFKKTFAFILLCMHAAKMCWLSFIPLVCWVLLPVTLVDDRSSTHALTLRRSWLANRRPSIHLVAYGLRTSTCGMPRQNKIKTLQATTTSPGCWLS